jgi:hemoglobin
MTNTAVRIILLSIQCFAGAAAFGASANLSPTLYERLGGETGVRAIADRLIDRVAADPVHGVSFKETNLKRIKRLLAEQICELAGGPCRYSGSPMQEAHAGLHITQADFYDMVAKLRVILAEQRVGSAATNELLRLLAPMKREVIDRVPAGAANAPAAPAAPAAPGDAAQ